MEPISLIDMCFRDFRLFRSFPLHFQESVRDRETVALLLLTEIRMRNMVIHMKTTLNISDVTMREVKREAALRRKTMSEFVEAALRAELAAKPRSEDIPPLPAFDGGGARVNVANRETLYTIMEG